MSEPDSLPDPFVEPLQREWLDADDELHEMSDDVARRLLDVIGTPPDDAEDTAPVVTRRGRSTGLHGVVHCEDGNRWPLADVVPDDLPFGYHDLVSDGPDGSTTRRRLIVSPGRCWLPEEPQWGWAVQVYGLHSATSAGVGDLDALRAVREWTEELGGGFLLVNPLHAVAPVLPLETSPYLPATRRFRNPVYLAVEGLTGPDGPDAATAAQLDVSVDRDAAWTRKLTALRQRFDVGLPDDERRAFDTYRAEQGRPLAEFALWWVLAGEHGADFHDWPADLRDPQGAAAAAVGAERDADVEFAAWLQFLLAEQLDRATGDLTVIQDLPIGVSGGGVDAWVWQGVLADGVTVGAPPDLLNTSGQDWDSPPFVPWRLRALDYEPFVESVRATIAGAGGLRIDHVMGLFRLWWIPEGTEATDGGYVRYPADDLLDIVCLESHRARAVVVGEDLGTVEPGVREALAERRILSYRVLYFEDDDPATWPRLSLGAVTTHDLATVAGLVSGADAEEQAEATGADPADVEAGNADLIARVERDGALPAAEDGPDGPEPDARVAAAIDAAYAQLGRAGSLLTACSLEDAVGEVRRPNVPGTTERDNWRVPLAVAVEDLPGHPGPGRLLAALEDGRAHGPSSETRTE